MLSSFINCRCRALSVSKTEFARRGGFSRETLYRILRGDLQSATIDTIYRLAKASEVAPIYLLRLAYHDLAAVPATTLTTLHAGDHTSFVQDVTIPDNDMVLANQVFTKIWAIQNTGSVVWKDRSFRCMDEQLVIARRDDDGALTPVLDANLVPEKCVLPVSETPPGKTVHIEVNFQAPTLPCTVLSLWKMFDGEGKLCFPEFSGIWCKVQVVAI